MALQVDFKRTVILARDCGDAGFSKKRRVEFAREGAYQCFVTFAKCLERRTLTRTLLGFCDAEHAANDAARGLFGFVKLWEGAANAEMFGIPRVNARNEGANEAIEQL